MRDPLPDEIRDRVNNVDCGFNSNYSETGVQIIVMVRYPGLFILLFCEDADSDRGSKPSV